MVLNLAVGRESPRAPRRDVATVLEEIEVPPRMLTGVVDLVTFLNPGVREARPFCEIDLYVQFHQGWVLLCWLYLD